MQGFHLPRLFAEAARGWEAVRTQEIEGKGDITARTTTLSMFAPAAAPEVAAPALICCKTVLGVHCSFVRERVCAAGVAPTHTGCESRNVQALAAASTVHRG